MFDDGGDVSPSSGTVKTRPVVDEVGVSHDAADGAAADKEPAVAGVNPKLPPGVANDDVDEEVEVGMLGCCW